MVSMADAVDDDPPDAPTTRELVRKARAGEPGGFAALYGHTAPALYAWASARLPAHLAKQLGPEDVVQEVYLRAYDGFARFDAARSFRSWLFGIANNVLREQLRDAAGRLAGGGDRRPGGPARLEEVADDATRISRRVARDESLQRVLEHTKRLSDTERKVLALRGLEGMPHARIAALTGISVSASEKAWQRVREKLAELELPEELLAP